MCFNSLVPYAFISPHIFANKSFASLPRVTQCQGVRLLWVSELVFHCGFPIPNCQNKKLVRWSTNYVLFNYVKYVIYQSILTWTASLHIVSNTSSRSVGSNFSLRKLNPLSSWNWGTDAGKDCVRRRRGNRGRDAWMASPHSMDIRVWASSGRQCRAGEVWWAQKSQIASLETQFCWFQNLWS